METRFEPLREDDAAHRTHYNDVFQGIWPEFALTDEEFAEELAVSGPARRYLVFDVDHPDASAVGTLAVERVTWSSDDAPPIVYAPLDLARMSSGLVEDVVREAGVFAHEQGFTDLKVLAWDREVAYVDQVLGWDGWREVERAVDVAIDLTAPAPAPREFPAGVAMTTVAERPELLPGAYACLELAIADIPADEPEALPPYDEWLKGMRGLTARDEAIFLAVRDDEVVGFAGLEFRALLEDELWHGYTAVRPDARGLGLAFALKLATIEYARAAGFRSLRTENEARNAPMRHINAQLGYEPVAARMTLRGPIASIPAPLSHNGA